MASVRLAFDPTTDPTVIGYRLYKTQDHIAWGLAWQGTTDDHVGPIFCGSGDIPEQQTTYFHARSFNALGQESVPSGEVEYFAPLTAPVAISATRETNTRVVIRWRPTTISHTGFRVERSFLPGSGFGPASGWLPPNTVEFEDSAAQPHTQYFYRVRVEMTPAIQVDSAVVRLPAEK